MVDLRVEFKLLLCIAYGKCLYYGCFITFPHCVSAVCATGLLKFTDAVRMKSTKIVTVLFALFCVNGNFYWLPLPVHHAPRNEEELGLG